MQRKSEMDELTDILGGWDLPVSFPEGRFFPRTKVTGVIIQDDKGYRTIDAIWWFLLKEVDGKVKPDGAITCFNARNLDGRLWKGPFKTHRCLFPVTGIVETNEGKSFAMNHDQGFFLGGLYRTWLFNDQLVHSCTVITGNQHARFKQYHPKSIPLFMPNDKAFLDRWLDPTFTDSDYFKGYTTNPPLTVDLEVTPVNNSAKLERQGDTVILERDH